MDLAKTVLVKLWYRLKGIVTPHIYDDLVRQTYRLEVEGPTDDYGARSPYLSSRNQECYTLPLYIQSILRVRPQGYLVEKSAEKL